MGLFQDLTQCKYLIDRAEFTKSVTSEIEFTFTCSPIKFKHHLSSHLELFDP